MKGLLLCFVSIFVVDVFGIPDPTCKTVPILNGNETCCQLPVIIPIEVIQNCQEELIPKIQNYNNLTIDCMMSECILKKSELVKNDKLSRTELKRQIKAILHDDPKWHEITENAVNQCVEKGSLMENDLKAMSNAPYEIKDCDPIYAFYVNCIEIDIFVKCPAQFKTESENCNMARDYLNKCPHQYPPPMEEE